MRRSSRTTGALVARDRRSSSTRRDARTCSSIDEAIAAFYAERLPADVHSRAAFEAWRRDDERRASAAALPDARCADAPRGAERHRDAVSGDACRSAAPNLPLAYRFAPGHPLDGLTLTVPLALLNQVDESRAVVARPGHDPRQGDALPEGVAEGVAQPPRPVAGVGDRVPRASAARRTRRSPMRCARILRERLGDAPPAALLRARSSCRRICAINVRVVDAAGRELAMRPRSRARCASACARQRSCRSRPTVPRSSARACASGTSATLPETLTVAPRTAAPDGLSRRSSTNRTALRCALLDTREAARCGDAQGRRPAARLRARRCALAPPEGARRRGRPSHCSCAARVAARAACRTICATRSPIARFVGDDPLPRDREAFAAQVKRARARLPAVADGALRLLGAIAAEHHALSQRIAALPPAQRMLAADIRAQRDALVYPGFLAATPWAQLDPPAALPAGARRAASRVIAEHPERDARHAGAGRAVVGSATASARSDDRAGGAVVSGAGGVPLAARGAARFAVRAGAAHARARVVQTCRKGMGRALAARLTVLRQWHTIRPRARVSSPKKQPNL